MKRLLVDRPGGRAFKAQRVLTFGMVPNST